MQKIKTLMYLEAITALQNFSTNIRQAVIGALRTRAGSGAVQILIPLLQTAVCALSSTPGQHMLQGFGTFDASVT